MKSSTLCKNAKHKHQEKHSNNYLSQPTKSTNARMELERKNNGGGQPMTPGY
jgi:hypothetical protein